MRVRISTPPGATWFVGHSPGSPVMNVYGPYVMGQIGRGSDPEVYEMGRWDEVGATDSVMSIHKVCRKAGHNG